MNRCKGGDTAAFRRLMETHQGYAFALAFRMLCDEEEAKDAVQEAFIRVWKNIGRYDPAVKFTTWLYTIVTNLCLDALRARSHAAAIGQSRLVEAAAELSKLISGKQSVAEVSENWIVMNRQSFRQFLLLYNELKDDASRLPPEFREANPELMKLLEADRQSAQMEVLVGEREALIRELNRLVSSERKTP